MTTQTQGPIILIRLMIIAALIALLAVTTVQRAGAEEEADYHDLAMLEIAACEVAGGAADVNQIQTAAGSQAISVDCTGGLLDGMACSNTTDAGSECHWRDDEVAEHVVVVEDDTSAAAPGGIKTEDEPIASPADDSATAREPVEVQPQADASANPEPTAEVVAEDPTVVDGEVGGEPVVDDGVIIDESLVPELIAEPIQEPVVDDGRSDEVQEIAPGEVITLT